MRESNYLDLILHIIIYMKGPKQKGEKLRDSNYLDIIYYIHTH
jgi:hypothetical protein